MFSRFAISEVPTETRSVAQENADYGAISVISITFFAKRAINNL